MGITIIPEDKLVIRGGRGAFVTIDKINPDITAVQFDDSKSIGHIEYKQDSRMNEPIDNVNQFTHLLERYAEAIKKEDELFAEQEARLKDPYYGMTLPEKAKAVAAEVRLAEIEDLPEF